MPTATKYKSMMARELSYGRGTITRSAFLQAVLSRGGIPLIAATDVNNSGLATSHGFPNSHLLTVPTICRDIFYRLFLSNDEKVRYHVATEHYKHPGRIHFDDWAAAGSLRGTLKLLVDNIKIIQNPFLSGDFSGNLLCVGDGGPSLVARSILQYNIGPNLALVRDANPVLWLPFERVYDPATFPCLQPFVLRHAGPVEYYSPNTLIRDRRPGRDSLIEPRLCEQSLRLLTDYLLITVVPNLLDSESFYRGARIVIFGGTHGIGTRALGLLLNDKPLLQHLQEKVNGTKYWQALIEVSEIEHANDYEMATKINNENVQLYPVELDRKGVEAWLASVPLGSQAAMGREIEGISVLEPRDLQSITRHQYERSPRVQSEVGKKSSKKRGAATSTNIANGISEAKGEPMQRGSGVPVTHNGVTTAKSKVLEIMGGAAIGIVLSVLGAFVVSIVYPKLVVYMFGCAALAAFVLNVAYGAMRTRREEVT